MFAGKGDEGKVENLEECVITFQAPAAASVMGSVLQRRKTDNITQQLWIFGPGYTEAALCSL